MKEELADYILCLPESLAHTGQGDGRPHHEKYLAGAAVLLALAARGAGIEGFKREVEEPERWPGNTWAAGDEHRTVFEAWKKFGGLLE